MIHSINKINEKREIFNTKIKESLSKIDQRIKKTVSTAVNFLWVANQPVLDPVKVKKMTKDAARDDAAVVECCAQTCELCCSCCALFFIPKDVVYVRVI